jgi:GT2 family glycosyltransferase
MQQQYKSKTNIIVSCWNAVEHTKVTLESLFATIHHPYFLTIVDNASSDGTPEYLKNLAPSNHCENLIIISNEKNEGAGGAINQGQDVSKQYGLKYTSLCNNDLFFQDNWLQLLEKCMDGDDRLGIVGTLRPAVDTTHHTRNDSAKFTVDHSPKGLSITEELEFFQDGYTFDQTCKMLVEKNGGGVEVLRCPPNAVVTCCALVRNSVSEKIGLFSDPQFEIYGSEDLDLSWRLQKAGYICAILKDVYVHHFRHRSITASNLDREKCLLENNIKLYKKWKEDIFSFLDSERERDVDVLKNLTTEDNHEYFFLRRIEEKVKLIPEYIKKYE